MVVEGTHGGDSLSSALRLDGLLYLPSRPPVPLSAVPFLVGDDSLAHFLRY